MTLSERGIALSRRWKALFRDHEIYVRTGGDVRFLRVSAQVQRRTATLVLIALGLWLAFTVYMVGARSYDAWRAGDVAARAVAVERAESQLQARSGQISEQVRALDARQDYVEGVVRDLVAPQGGDAADAAVPAPDSETPDPAASPDRQIGALRQIGARQEQLVMGLTRLAATRAARAEAALAAVGIRMGSTDAQGGPFIPAERPAAHGAAIPSDSAFRRLANAFDRMQQLEQMVLSLPSTLPADGMNLSSGFGYRRDPFTGAGAMHAGLDFRGPHGSPIRAAAAGRVSFVGRQSGYGNTVEIDHGHGIMTRYAHMSGFHARVGQPVTAGQLIGRMGSTGRSTGTHLHFEVRLSGRPVNPRRFLEANPDVLEVQANLGQRTRVGGR